MKRALTIQKFTTCFLVVLLLLINGIKVFHTHSSFAPQQHLLSQAKQSSDRVSSHASVSKSSHRCVICDFHLYKEADLTESDLLAGIQSFPIVSNTAYISSAVLFVHCPSLLRGPPASV